MTVTDDKPLINHPLAWGVGLFCCLLGLAAVGFLLWPLEPLPARIQFNAAFSFILAGAALIYLAHGRVPHAQVCTLWPIAIGLLTFCEYISGLSLGIDDLIMKPDAAGPDPNPGRMGFNTATCFFLSGTVLFFLGLRLHYGWRLLLIGLTCLVLASAASVLISYLSQLAGLRHPYARMALPSSVGFIALAGGLLGMMYSQLKAARMGAPVAWPVLFILLALTLAAWHILIGYIADAARERFAVTVRRMESAIVQRMEDYERILHGSEGLFAASERVSRTEWRNYVNALRLQERYPAMQALGFTMRIPAKARAAHVKAVQAEGFPGYRIWPEEPPREEYYPNVYIEPSDWRNARAFGFDMYSEPVRRAAMIRARDTGDATLSGKVTLIQETERDVQAGFLMYAPVYASAPASLEERRSRLSGFVFIPFRAENLFNSIGAIHQNDISLRIFDGIQANAPALIYSTDGNAPEARQNRASVFQETRILDIAGRHWLLVYASGPSFESGMARHQPLLVLLGGAFVSFLVFVVIYLMATSRARAVDIAYEMTHKLGESERRYRDLVHNSLGLICSHAEDGKILYANPAAAAILGYSEAELARMNLRELIPGDAKEKFDDYLSRVLKNRRDNGLMAVLTRDNQRLIWRYDNHYYKSDDGAGYVLGHAQDVTEMYEAQRELKKVNALMREMATHDGLTGLCNRALLYEHMGKSIEYAARNGQSLAVLYLDLDGFKQVNDTLGHAAGDELLKKAAQTLSACCRKSDIAARLGGDEFAVLLNNIGMRADAAAVAEKIGEWIRSEVPTGDNRLKISASIGIACFPFDGDSIETLIQKADAAMYRAKQGGRNGYRFYEEEPAREQEQV